MNNFQASGPGTAFLPRAALQFLLTTDPFLGTSTAGVPDGPFNRELYKLLENDSALANTIIGYMSRSYGVSASVAPAVNTIPNPLTGAPSTPADLTVHAVFYTNYEVTYRYNGTSGVWVELARAGRIYTALVRHYKKITITLSNNEDNISVTLPTTDSLGANYTFTLDHLKTFYILNLDENAPIVSVLPGIINDAGVLRVVATTAPTTGSNYQLVMIFESIVGI